MGLDKFNKTMPIEQINVRGINVAVWEHENKDNGNKFRQVTIKKSYKDDNGDIKEVQSIQMNEIPQLIQQLTKIYQSELDKFKK